MTHWKTKLDVLNHKLQLAQNLQQHLQKISNKIDQPIEPPKATPEEKKELTVQQVFHKNKTIREKAFINAVSNISSYKTGEFYQLELLNKSVKNLDPSKTNISFNTLIHQSTVKVAKRRLSQIVSKLLRDIKDNK